MQKRPNKNKAAVRCELNGQKYLLAHMCSWKMEKYKTPEAGGVYVFCLERSRRPENTFE